MDSLELPMAYDFGIGVIDFQRAEQGDEGCTLSRGAGVGRATTVIETALVTDADGMGIVMPGVSTDHLFWAADVELAVAGDVVVVAAAVPAFGTVHVVEHLESDVLVRAGGCTVNNKQIYSTHSRHDLEVHARLHEEG